MAAETQALCSGIDDCHRTRAIMADMVEMLDVRDWEATSSRTRKCLWLSDCEDLVSHLVNATPKPCEDIRTEIDVSGLRQLLWEYPDGTQRDSLAQEDITDKILWIDTSAMLADCMTKKMSGSTMREFIQKGHFSLRASDESVLLKLRKQKGIRDKKAKIVADTLNAVEIIVPDDNVLKNHECEM